MSNKNKNQNVNEEIKDEVMENQTQPESAPAPEANQEPAKANVGQKILGGIRTAGHWVGKNKKKILTIGALAGGAVLGILNKDKIASACCPDGGYEGEVENPDSIDSADTGSTGED